MALGGEVEVSLRRLVRSHGIPLVKLAEKMDMSPQECLEWWSGHRNRLPLSKVRNFVGAAGATVDDLVAGRMNTYSIEIGILDFEEVINPKYAANAFSYTMSSKHVIEFLSLKYGTHRTNEILARLGVHRSYFDNTQNRINISFFEDILREFLGLGNSIEELRALSKAIFLTTEENTEGARLFPRCTTYSDALNTVYEATRSFDENFEYEFEVTPTRAKIITKPSERLVEATKNRSYGSRELYEYRSALIGNLVLACGLKPLKMKVQRCVMQGDTESVYEADFPSCHFLGNEF